MSDGPIAFIGLGRLGLPIAGNCLDAGYALRVWNRTAAKCDALVARGAVGVGSPADAVTPGGILVTLLWDDASVIDVLKSDGLLERLGDGVHVSMSTLSPDGVATLAALHEDAGSTLVEAPIFGGRDAAAARDLHVPIAGPAEAKARVRPLVEAMGARTITDFGETIGSASAVKLAGNMLILSASAALREALGLAEARGVEPGRVLEMLTTTLFPSPIYRHHGRLAVERSTLLRQSAIPAKDLGLFEQAATGCGASAEMARFVAGYLVR